MERIGTDLLVIDPGVAGKWSARAVGSFGGSVVMVGKSAQIHGGVCINIVCGPTKVLVHQGDIERGWVR